MASSHPSASARVGASAGARPPLDALAVGIVGAGRLAERVHFDALGRTAGCRVAAVADPSPARRELARRRFPAAVLCTDLAELLERAHVEAVIISSPPAHHASAARLALQAGKHVYVEKPIATVLDDAERLVAVWRESGRVAMVGFNYRFHPAVLALRRQIQEGRLGRPLALRTTFTSARREVAPWQLDRQSGGGALLELGSHHFDLAPFLLAGEPRRISAVLSSREQPDDTATVWMHLAGGISAQFFFALGAADVDRIEIIGDAEIARLDRLRGVLRIEPASFEYSRGATLRRELARIRGSISAVVRPVGEPSYSAALRAFISAARDGVQQEPSLEQGLRSLRLVDAAERAAAADNVLEIRDTATVPLPSPDS